MFQAATGDTVKVKYAGKLQDGTLFDASPDDRPLQFIIGKNEVIPGFEEAVVGMMVGEKRTVTIPPEKAYGAPKAEFVEEVDRSDLPADLQLTLGGKLEVTRQDGSLFYVAVVGLTDSKVTLDANHPLAGKDLIFDIDMLDVEKKPAK